MKQYLSNQNPNCPNCQTSFWIEKHTTKEIDYVSYYNLKLKRFKISNKTVMVEKGFFRCLKCGLIQN